jgi:small-conductance mechanosensitive channel
MKSTRLRALTGEEKIISNSKLLEKEITNNTLTVYRRVNFPISLVYHTPPATAAKIPDLLQEIVEANGSQFIRAGFTTFGASSLDFQLVFDVNSDDVEEMFKARHAIGIAIVERFAKDGIEFAYPTQTTFTAAPDGTLVMPYAPPASTPKPRAKN